MKDQEICHICKRVLDQEDDPTTKNCGGDCLQCMADCGDPDCLKEITTKEKPWKLKIDTSQTKI